MVLLAGCGNNNTGGDPGNISAGGDESSTDTPDAQAHFKTADMNDGWPAADLPQGFPKYPGGDQYYLIEDGIVSIIVLETDNNTFNDYMDSLKSFGFDFEPGADEKGTYHAIMTPWGSSLSFYEEWNAAMINVFDFGSDLVLESGEWPVELPMYPEGNIFVDASSSNVIKITVENTSKASLEKYYEILKNAGWERSIASDYKDFDTFDKGILNVDFNLHDDGTTLTIWLMEIEIE